MKLMFLRTLVMTVVLCANSLPSFAGLISGDQTTEGGKHVALQGLEWMSLEHTAGMSRNTVEGGFTDRYGTVWEAGVWEYATRAQTETMLTSLWGGTYDGWASSNYDGAKWFADNFGMLAYDSGRGETRVDRQYDDIHTNITFTGYDFSSFYFGAQNECVFGISRSCFGEIKINLYDNIHITGNNTKTGAIFENSYIPGTGGIGHMTDKGGFNMGTTPSNFVREKSEPDEYTGSLLVRVLDISDNNDTAPIDDIPVDIDKDPVVDVPEPSTLFIFALGIIGLASRRFTKQS